MPLKSLYVIFYGIVATALTYQTLFFEERGLSSIQIGLAQTAQGFGVLLMPLIFAHFADKHMSARNSLAICLIILGCVHILLLSSHAPWLLISGAFLYSLFYAPVFSLIDASALDQVRRNLAKSFTEIRIWGSLGFLVPAILLFPFVQRDLHGLTLTVWYGTVSCFLSAFIVLKAIPPGAPVEASSSMLPSQGALVALFKPELRAFTLSRFLTQVGVWVWYPFFPLYLRDSGFDAAWIGPIINVGVIAETIFAYVSARFSISIAGRGIAAIAAFSVAIRMILIALLPANIYFIIVLQLLHAPYIWAMYFRGTVYLTTHAEDRFRTSLLALNGIILGGVTRAIGGPLGGYLSGIGGHLGGSGVAHALFWGGMISALGGIIGIFFIPKKAQQAQ